MPKLALSCRVVLVCILAAATPSPSGAQTNLGLAVGAFFNSQENPVVVSDGAGGAIVAWQDLRNGVDWNIYAQHVLATGVLDPSWPSGALAVCTALSNQINLRIATDGAGGAIVVWQDSRAGNGRYDVYAHHILSTGSLDPAWPGDGRALCTAPFDQTLPAVVEDGAGGAIAVWQDTRTANDGNHDIYAQRVLSTGVVDPNWPVDGRAVCTDPFNQTGPVIAPDGAGGAYIAWQDARVGTLDIYAHHVSASGAADPAWPVNGLVVCGAGGHQSAPELVSDGTGGALVAWEDGRLLSFDIYAHHLLVSGSTDPAWPNGGLPVCTAPSQQDGPALASDGAGGAIIAWTDQRFGASDIYAHRALSTGVVDAAWPVDGRSISSASNSQHEPAVVSDDAGGAFIVWRDDRNGVDSDVFAQRVLATGSTAPFWPDGGLPVCAASGFQLHPAVTADGNGGAVIAWMDSRRSGYDIYAQRLSALGGLLFPDGEIPEIVSVRDIPGDQGGKVKLSWNASGADRDGSGVVDEYWIWRSVPPNLVAERMAEQNSVVHAIEDASASAPAGLFVSTSRRLAGYFWEFYASQRAGMLDGYSLVCRTEMDSLASGNPFTVFFVQARSSDGTFVRNTAPDSGYSVDNLAPATPMPFVGQFLAGKTALHWGISTAADFGEFRLYRGSTGAFVPTSENLIFAGNDTGYVDHGHVTGYYKLAAVDLHGNLSRFALVSPSIPTATLASLVSADWTGLAASLVWYGAGLSGTSVNLYRNSQGESWVLEATVSADFEGYVRYMDTSVLPGRSYAYRLGVFDGGVEVIVGETSIAIPAAQLAIRAVSPNPVRGDVLNFAVSLASTEPASVRVLDLAGRTVRQLAFPGNPTGTMTIPLAGAAPLRAGVYLVELRQANQRAVTRFIYLK